MKQSRGWIAQEPGGDGPWDTGAELALNAHGWPRLEPGQAAGTLIYRNVNGHYPAGDYTCLFEGTGELHFGFDAKAIERSPGRIRVAVTPGDEGIYLRIDASDPADPIRNVRLILPGFEATYAAAPFHPLFLERLAPFGVLRFMDWQRTNNSTNTAWAERATPATFSQATDRGVALEHMLALCNTLGADPWFCMPHGADDPYVTSFAAAVRAQLAPNLRVWIEHSNEVWNDIFAQSRFAEERGLAADLASDPYEARLRYHSRRSVEIFRLWERAFDGTERLVRVLGAHADNAWTGEQVVEFEDAYRHADALAIAPYFGGGLGHPRQARTTARASAEELLELCRSEIETEVAKDLRRHAGHARKRSLALVAYEGGPHLVALHEAKNDATLVERLIETNRAEGMHALYSSYLALWRQLGGSTFVAFDSCGLPSRHGSWGLLEYQDQPSKDAPKYRALVDFAQALTEREPAKTAPGADSSKEERAGAARF